MGQIDCRKHKLGDESTAGELSIDEVESQLKLTLTQLVIWEQNADLSQKRTKAIAVWLTPDQQIIRECDTALWYGVWQDASVVEAG